MGTTTIKGVTEDGRLNASTTSFLKGGFMNKLLVIYRHDDILDDGILDYRYINIDDDDWYYGASSKDVFNYVVRILMNTYGYDILTILEIVDVGFEFSIN